MTQTLTGTIVPYAGPVTSTTQFESQGWLLCDGSQVPRKKYPNLYSVISVLYGQGDEVNTFNLPNYQGQFLRGVSNGSGVDPDTNNRTSQINSSGKSGTSQGNEVGSFQDDEYASHSHSLTAALNNSTPDISNKGDDWNFAWNNSITTNPSGGNETRSKNVYVNYLICIS